jgi:fucose permease
LKNVPLFLSLIFTYIIFAILLNSVGTVILQVINEYNVSKTQASILEGFKDLPIAIVSFFVASYLPRLGFIRAMQIGLVAVALACLAMPFFPSFAMTKILFLLVGASFALVKVSVYSLIGLLTDDAKQHASILNTVEGCFMLGVLSGFWLFGLFIDGSEQGNWLKVYWYISGLAVINIVLLQLANIDENKPPQSSNESTVTEDGIKQMLNLIWFPLVLSFILAVFLYVLIEQSLGTWLPTFNNEIMNLPSNISVQITSIFALALAIGRLSAGGVLRYISWYPILNICIIAMAGLMLLVLPLTQGLENTVVSGWSEVPLAAYLLPLIGLFMAPIYPAINSVVLSALPKHKHASMTGLIVVFSALGGTSGSFVTGWTFAHFTGQVAFYLSLIPMALLMVLLFIFKKQLESN